MTGGFDMLELVWFLIRNGMALIKIQISVHYGNMKTTLNIQDALLIEAKALATVQRLTLTPLVEDGTQLRLRGANAAPVGKRSAMPVVNGGMGLAKGLSGLSTREMLDAADHVA
jgi:hypothetical protein